MEDIQAVQSAEVVEEPRTDVSEADLGDLTSQDDAQSEVEGQEATPETPDTDKAGQEAEPLPREVSKLLKELRSSGNYEAKTLRAIQDSYYAHKSYAEVFPNIEDARLVKATLDTVGGLDGLNKLQESVTTLEDLDRMADEGNPELIKAFVSESTDGFKKLAPVVMEELRKIDPEAYSALLREPLINAIQDSGLAERLNRVQQAMQSGYGDMALSELKYIFDWLGGLDSLKVRPQDARSGNDEVSRRMSSLDQRESDLFNRQISEQTTSWLEGRIATSLGKLSGSLSAEAKKDLYSSIISELDKTFMSDKPYQDRMGALIRRRDVDSALGFMKANVDKVLQATANSVWQRRYGHLNQGTTVSRQASPQRQATVDSAGWMKLTKRPEQEQIDTNQTDIGMLVRHKAILKSGKRVTWPY